jgi:hypothetical protein
MAGKAKAKPKGRKPATPRKSAKAGKTTKR